MLGVISGALFFGGLLLYFGVVAMEKFGSKKNAKHIYIHHVKK